MTAKPMSLLSRGKGHHYHYLARSWGVASICSLMLLICSLLPMLLHNARKKAPHNRRHGRGLKRPVPDERDEQIPDEA